MNVEVYVKNVIAKWTIIVQDKVFTWNMQRCCLLIESVFGFIWSIKELEYNRIQTYIECVKEWLRNVDIVGREEQRLVN